MGLPIGPTVTFLFTDIEGSTRLERAMGSAAWASVVARHDEIARSAIERAGGAVVKTEGDAVFAAFPDAADAIGAAVYLQCALADEAWAGPAPLTIRAGLHTGEGRLRDDRGGADAPDYVGIDVNYTARLAAAANGRQLVVSDATVRAIGDVAGVAGRLGVTFVDEGLRALKDFEEPERVHRIVVPAAADDARPLRTLEAPSNLPSDVTSLVGRDAEVAGAAEALVDSRVVTLSGPGGSGKTRLALAVARTTRDRFPHGTWFVDLAAIRDASLIEPSIAATLGIRESRDEPIDVVIRNHLRDRSVLLVLDNLEQLLPEAADIVAAIVRAAANVRILATSRELLRITGEHAYPVPPLDVTAGVELFLERARAHRADAVQTAADRAAARTICERLGGLPLAIELAAARVRSLNPEQILDRLARSLDLGGGPRDLPERQRTLRGAIAWSHDLLPVEERRLFRRIGVFSDGWTLDTASAVADGDGDLGVDLLDGLESLADKSLVRVETLGGAGLGRGGTRYGVHPLLREFAVEQLTETGERDGLEARHAMVMAEVAERLGGELFTATGEDGMRELDRESSNLRSAIGWSATHDEPAIGLRILGATWRWFQQRGRLREGSNLLDDLLARPFAVDPRIRIAGLAAAGGLAYWMDDVGAARAAYDERFALAESTGDDGLVADAHYDLGFLSMLDKDEERLRYHEERALELYLASGRDDAAIRARQALVLAVYLGGDYETARVLEAENLAAFERRGSLSEVADSATLMSAILFRLGEPELAWDRMLQGLRMFDANKLSSGVARNLVMAAIIQLVHGDPVLGTRLAGAVAELARRDHVMLAPVKVLHLPDPAEVAVERLGSDRAQELLALGAALPLEIAIDEALRAEAPGSPVPGGPSGVV
jgi:predicted ATPase/class 3 adenylate cyclase